MDAKARPHTWLAAGPPGQAVGAPICRPIAANDRRRPDGFHSPAIGRVCRHGGLFPVAGLGPVTAGVIGRRCWRLVSPRPRPPVPFKPDPMDLGNLPKRRVFVKHRPHLCRRRSLGFGSFSLAFVIEQCALECPRRGAPRGHEGQVLPAASAAATRWTNEARFSAGSNAAVAIRTREHFQGCHDCGEGLRFPRSP
jgi:hypothetical protein